MHTIEGLVSVSVSRGCGFAILAIVMMMLGLSFDPVRALELGGVGFLMMASILMLKARHAPLADYRKTEVWIMLERDQRPPSAIAQQVIAQARQSALQTWAYFSLWIAAILLALALLLMAVL